MENDPNNFAFIIRASGESTLASLEFQLQKQISSGDSIHILQDNVPFEEKLKQGFELGVLENKKFTVFIDADILLKSMAISRIKKLAVSLEEKDLGFGIKLWDRFYDRPKFRGFHVYRTALIPLCLQLIPSYGEELRPESFVKQEMKKRGYRWRNDLSQYIGGIHDYFQNLDDVYYKFLVRSKRSEEDIESLINFFQKKERQPDFAMALKGLQDGQKMRRVINDKSEYVSLSAQKPNKIISSKKVDRIIFWNLANYYRFNSQFWKSL